MPFAIEQYSPNDICNVYPITLSTPLQLRVRLALDGSHVQTYAKSASRRPRPRPRPSVQPM